MRAAITITHWFAHETKRIYMLLNDSEEQEQGRQILELIRNNGGSITARDLSRTVTGLTSAAEAERILQGLVKAGFGQWRDRKPGETGGRPTREFTLAETDET